MKELFEEHYKFMGDLSCKNSSLEDLICELKINTLYTEEMIVKLTPTKGTFISIYQSLIEDEPIYIKSKENTIEIILEVQFSSLELSSKTGDGFYYKVLNCTIITPYSGNENIAKINCQMSITDSALFTRERSFTNHYSKGILAGWSENSNEWQEEKYIFKVGDISFKVIPSFKFGDLPLEGKQNKAKMLIDQINIHTSFEINKNSLIEFEKDLLNKSEYFLKIILYTLTSGEDRLFRQSVSDWKNLF